jgi:hypothetical protein
VVKDRVFFVGLEGSFELPGVVGLGIKLAFSELGPLGVMLHASTPTGVMIEPVTGLTINNFNAGVEFFKTLPSISEPEQLRGPEFAVTNTVDAAAWLASTQDQVVKQYKKIKENPNQSGFLAAFTSPMLISASADIYTQYGSQYSIAGNIAFKLDTGGRFMAGGSLKFFGGIFTTSAKLYADLSEISKGNAKILLLVD